MIRLALILAVLAAPAYAIDAPEKPPVEKPEPEQPAEPPSKPRQPADKGNPYTPQEPQHWTGVCEYLPDGRLLVHTAFLRNPQIAAQQCREWLEERE